MFCNFRSWNSKSIVPFPAPPESLWKSHRARESGCRSFKLGISHKYIENFYYTLLSARTWKWSDTNRQESMRRIETRNVSKNYFAEAEVILNILSNKTGWYSKRKKNSTITIKSARVLIGYFEISKHISSENVLLTGWNSQLFTFANDTNYQQLSITTKMGSNASFLNIWNLFEQTLDDR